MCSCSQLPSPPSTPPPPPPSHDAANVPNPKAINHPSTLSVYNIYIPHPTRRPSISTASLYRIRLAHITPRDPAQDPYTVALFVALVQSPLSNLIRTRDPSAANATSFQVYVLLGHHSEKTRLLVYTAGILNASLKRLAGFQWTPLTPTNFVLHTIQLPLNLI
ncbi:hypothetical protein LX36DRAFT_705175 [Colletotrichum falcatum]|nr:hypothetical protein LX36DRAFT_705175 [Colletotrichum falcatum]